jgi:hypothetical protein
MFQNLPLETSDPSPAELPVFDGGSYLASAATAKPADLLPPFLKWLTILLWATASWWIPLLALLACWQH